MKYTRIIILALSVYVVASKIGEDIIRNRTPPFVHDKSFTAQEQLVMLESEKKH